MGNGFWARPPTSGPGSPHPCHRAMRGTIPRWPHPYFPSAGRPASSNPVPASPSTVPPAKHRPAECGRERWKSGRVVATIREIGRFRRRRAPILWGFFSRLRAGKAVATCDGRHRLQPAFGIPCARANIFGGQTAHAEGPWSANSPTGALAAMAWLVVTAMLTLIAAFIAVALA
jgi:hypothetical protein